MSAYLVFLATGAVDDALAAAIRDRVRAVPDAGWFDGPGEERTTGGYVRVESPEVHNGQGLLAAARDLSETHGVVVEVQWREEVLGHLDGGAWRPAV